MAGLKCGSFGLSKNVKENKSYIHVKLTDCAIKAIDEGQFTIPNRSSGSTNFIFFLQDADQQGSYESIKQIGSRDLVSLGPMASKMKIVAKQTESFQNTRDKMAADNEKNNN